MDIEQAQEHQNRVNFGEQAKAFLAGRDWLDIVKPIIDSMIKGLDSVKDVQKSLASAKTKVDAEIEILGRSYAVEYLEKIEPLIGAYMTDGDVSRKLLEKQQTPEPDSLFRTEE